MPPRMQTAGRLDPYERLLSLPETLTGEILNGKPRPYGPHAIAGIETGFAAIERRLAASYAVASARAEETADLRGASSASSGTWS
jgi:hypothetical protein